MYNHILMDLFKYVLFPMLNFEYESGDFKELSPILLYTKYGMLLCTKVS